MADELENNLRSAEGTLQDLKELRSDLDSLRDKFTKGIEKIENELRMAKEKSKDITRPGRGKEIQMEGKEERFPEIRETGIGERLEQKPETQREGIEKPEIREKAEGEEAERPFFEKPAEEQPPWTKSKGLVETASEVAHLVKEKVLSPAIETGKETGIGAKESLEAVGQKMQGMSRAAVEKAKQMGQKGWETAQKTTEKARELGQRGSETTQQATEKAQETGGRAIETGKEVVGKGAETMEQTGEKVFGQGQEAFQKTLPETLGAPPIETEKEKRMKPEEKEERPEEKEERPEEEQRREEQKGIEEIREEEKPRGLETEERVPEFKIGKKGPEEMKEKSASEFLREKAREEAREFEKEERKGGERMEQGEQPSALKQAHLEHVLGNLKEKLEEVRQEVKKVGGIQTQEQQTAD